MKMDVITFRSITPAQRGQRMLQRQGIETVLQRTPVWMQEQGCGYCLRLRSQQTPQAVHLLRTEQLPFSKVYTWRAGRAEEVEL